MEEIYTILSKHFLNEATDDEEAKALAFKKENQKEYAILSEIWNRENIDIREFDSHVAWEKFKKAAESERPVKTIPLYRSIRHIAAVLVVLLLGSFATIYFTGQFAWQNIMLVENHEKEPMSIELADGSTVWLNGNSSLQYSKKFNDEDRALKLQGEAFFEVVKNPDQPFEVSTGNAKITVLGTSFNINTSDNITKVDVKTGRVEVFSKKAKKTAILERNTSAIVNHNDLVHLKSSDPNYLSWKTGEFVFDDTPLEQVIKDLNKFYKDRIFMMSSKKYDCSLTAKFNNSELHEIMEVIKITCDVNIHKHINGNYQIN